MNPYPLTAILIAFGVGFFAWTHNVHGALSLLLLEALLLFCWRLDRQTREEDR